MTVHDVIVGLLGFVQILLGWIVRDAFRRIDKLESQAAMAAAMPGRVEDHEGRLRAMEAGLADIRTDVKVIRSILETINKKET